MALRVIHEGGGFTDEEFALFFDENAPPPPSRGPLFVLSSRRGIGVALAKRREMLEAQGVVPRVFGIVPSGWVSTTQKKKAKHESYSDVYRVPYSIHSSYSEILELVAAVRPCRVVPIVPDSPCPYQVIAPLLSGKEPRHVDIPPSLRLQVPQPLSPGKSRQEPVVVEESGHSTLMQRKGLKVGVSKAKADLIAADTRRLMLEVAVVPKKEAAENDIQVVEVKKQKLVAKRERPTGKPADAPARPKKATKPPPRPEDVMNLLRETSRLARESQGK